MDERIEITNLKRIVESAHRHLWFDETCYAAMNLIDDLDKRIAELQATIERVREINQQLTMTGKRMMEQGLRERDDPERIASYALQITEALGDKI